MFQGLKSLFKAKPPVECLHPEFGVLTFDSGLWGGIAQCDGRHIRFYTGGTESAPDEGLLRCVRELLARFADLERTAVDFLHSQSPGIAGTLTFYSLDLLWEDKPYLFAMDFSLASDDDGIWRVEFEHGQPKHVGRDE